MVRHKGTILMLALSGCATFASSDSAVTAPSQYCAYSAQHISANLTEPSEAITLQTPYSLVSCQYKQKEIASFTGDLHFNLKCPPGQKIILPGFNIKPPSTYSAPNTTVTAFVPKVLAGPTFELDVVTYSKQEFQFDLTTFALCGV